MRMEQGNPTSFNIVFEKVNTMEIGDTSRSIESFLDIYMFVAYL